MNRMQRIKYREYIAKISSSEKIEYSQFDPMEEDDSRVEKRWNRRWFKLRDEPLFVFNHSYNINNQLLK